MLNKQKGNMYGFINYTLNFVKGRCPLECNYCHPAGTMIMMGDCTQKNIEDIKPNDVIIGVIKGDPEYSSRDGGNRGFYRFTKSKVVNVSTRVSKTIKFTTEDSELCCTPEHPLMGSTSARNCSDWKAARAFTPYENLRYISHLSREVSSYSKEQRFGYLTGIRDGDGCIFKYKTQYKDHYKGFEMVCVDAELYSHVKSEFKELLDIELKDGFKYESGRYKGKKNKMLFTRQRLEATKIENILQFRLNEGFAKGYLAGMIDTDGSVGLAGPIRISQSRSVNLKKYNNLIECCKLLNLKYVEEFDRNIIRINGSFQVKMRLLFEFGIFHSKKSQRLFLSNTYKGSKHSQITKIEVSGEHEVFNLQTECENFIANGFLVHNCYMKRWGNLREVRLDEKEFKTNLGSGNFIFVGSSCDMFADDIPDEWIVRILEYCSEYDNKYLFQSKNPKRFLSFEDKFPEHTVLTTTLESDIDYIDCKAPSMEDRAGMMQCLPLKFPRMLTIEPIMKFNLDKFMDLIVQVNPFQVNIGADSCGHKLNEPSSEEIKELITAIKKKSIEVHLKKNLKRLYKE